MVKDNNSRSRRRTIGIDASRANVESRTGVEWYAFNVIQELKTVIPDDVRVVLYTREPLRDGLEDLPAHWESRVLRWPWRFWTQIRLSLEMLIRPPDLLFVPAHTLPMVVPRHCAVTLHDVAFAAFPDAYSLPSRMYHRWATRHAARHADPILTVSSFSKDEIVRWFDVAKDRVTVTHLGFDPTQYGRPDEAMLVDALKRYGIARPYFLYVGRLERKKNIGGLLKAYMTFDELWPNAQASLVLVGKRGHGYNEEVGEGLPDGVRELGYVCQDDMSALYAGAEALVFVSGYEGFGLPALESFACGTPVIASDSTSLPEVVGNAAFLVDPYDANAVARAMHRVMADTAYAEEMVHRGGERATHFSWKGTAEATWEALRKRLSDV